jgi:hypothetical protein
VGRHLLTFESQKLKKEKDKANKRILRSLSFDNNGLVKPSCNNVAPVTNLQVSEHLGLYY